MFLTMNVTASIFGPTHIPAAILSRMEAVIAKARNCEHVRKRMLRMGLNPAAMNSTQFTASSADESSHMRIIVKAIGYQPELSASYFNFHRKECLLCSLRTPNACAMEKARDTGTAPEFCWCIDAVFTPEVLALLPQQAQGKACIRTNCDKSVGLR